MELDTFVFLCIAGFFALFFPIAVLSMQHISKLQKTGRIETKKWIYTAVRRNPSNE